MAQFQFTIDHGGKTEAFDVELDTAESALLDAVATAGEILKDVPRGLLQHQPWQMVVRDAAGAEVVAINVAVP